MSDQAEPELFLRARAGDRAAFDRLQARMEAPVRRFIFRLIGRSDAEDDIVRNVLLALYQNLERIEPAEHLRPFLFRVARNLCCNELRRQGRFQTVSLDAGCDDAESPSAFLEDRRPAPEDVVHWSLLYGEVQKAMERLPELHRQALILYCEEDLSYAQIAEAMATDIGTIKSRIHYARTKLVKLLMPEIRRALGLCKEIQT